MEAQQARSLAMEAFEREHDEQLKELFEHIYRRAADGYTETDMPLLGGNIPGRELYSLLRRKGYIVLANDSFQITKIKWT